MTTLQIHSRAIATAASICMALSSCSKPSGSSKDAPPVVDHTKAEPGALVGRPLNSISNICKEVGWSVLGSSTTLASVQLDCDGQQLIVFERMVGRNGRDPKWFIMDGIHLPEPDSGAELIPPGFCSADSYKSDTIFAIGKWKRVSDGCETEKILHAWRFNNQQEKIQPISISGVKCDSDDPNPPD